MMFTSADARKIQTPLDKAIKYAVEDAKGAKWALLTGYALDPARGEKIKSELEKRGFTNVQFQDGDIYFEWG